MSERKQEQRSRLWKVLTGLGMIISVVLVFQAFSTARKAEKSPLERAQERAAELKEAGVELPLEVNSDASEIAARVNASRAKSADLEQPTMPVKPSRPSLDGPELPKDKALNYKPMNLEGYSYDLAKYVDLTDGEDMESAELRIRAYFVPDDMSEGKSSTSYEKTYQSGGITKVIATRDGLMDDSVKGEQLVAYFIPTNPTHAELASYGMRVKCWRGPNKDTWQTELCP